MKSKGLLLILVMSLILILADNCLGFIPINEDQHPLTEATFVITGIEQSKWGDFVLVYYEIKNIGILDIDYYQVLFTITCADGHEYTDWDNGLYVKVDDTLSAYALVDIGKEGAISARVKDYELVNFKYHGK